MEEKKIIICIPAYNEQETINQAIQEIKKVMANCDYSILVVDDGSIDNTAQIAKENGAYVISHPKNYGLAETYKTEMDFCEYSNFDIIIHIDADLQYKADEIPLLINKLDSYDLVLGSRFLGTIEYMPSIKRIGNKIFSKTLSWITGIKFTDAQTGFRCFKKESISKMPVNSNYTYTHETIIQAVKNKLRIIEVPVTFRKRNGPSRLMRNPFDYAWHEGINLLKIFRDYKPLNFFGIIALCFLLPGLIMGSRLTFWYLTKGHIYNKIPSAIVCLMLILLGVQVFLFGFLADIKR